MKPDSKSLHDLWFHPHHIISRTFLKTNDTYNSLNSQSNIISLQFIKVHPLDHLDECSIYRMIEEVLSSMRVLNGLPNLELVPWRKG